MTGPPPSNRSVRPTVYGGATSVRGAPIRATGWGQAISLADPKHRRSTFSHAGAGPVEISWIAPASRQEQDRQVPVSDDVPPALAALVPPPPPFHPVIGQTTDSPGERGSW